MNGRAICLRKACGAISSKREYLCWRAVIFSITNRSGKVSNWLLIGWMEYIGLKNFNIIMLTNSTIRMLNYEVLSKLRQQPHYPIYLNKNSPYILEIKNDTRKYVLRALSEFDLIEWYKAIKF